MATLERIEELKVQLENIRKEWKPGPFCKTLHDDLSCSFSDLFKEYNGFRPRWVNTSEMSELEILIEMDDLVERERRVQEWEEEQDRLREERRQQEEQMVERIKREGVGELPEPEWKQQLRTLA